MSLLDSELQDGLSEMEADQADDGVSKSFTFGGYEWPCSRNTNKAGSAYENGGKVVLYDFAIRVRRNAVDLSGAKTFSEITPPVSGNLLTQDGSSYRVEFVDTAHGAFLTLLLTFKAK